MLAVIADVGGYTVAGLARSSRLRTTTGYDSLLQLFERLRDRYPQLRRWDFPLWEVLPKVRTVGVIDIVVGRRVHRADVPE